MTFVTNTIQFIVRAISWSIGWTFEIIQLIESAILYPFKRTEYVRIGGCKNSGTCCKALGIVIPKWLLKIPGVERYFVWWHHYCYNFNYIGTNDNMLVYSCNHLTEDNKCSIYRWRPRMCRQFPHVTFWGMPDIHKGCGFSFKKRNQN